jgi:hypothetical protein
VSGPETAHPIWLELVAVQAESAPEGVGQPVLTGQSLPESEMYVQSNASRWLGISFVGCSIGEQLARFLQAT